MNKLKIERDEWCSSPREWDNLGTMVCFHSRYDLGDKHDYNSSDYDSWEEMKNAIIKNEDVAEILPIYLYDHSGITISTSPFGCRWDSGQIGWIYTTKEQSRRWFLAKRITKRIKRHINEILIAEVEEYDQYIRGNCYCYTIEDEDGNEIDSCGGFIGDDPLENGLLYNIDSSLLGDISDEELLTLCKEQMYGI